MDEEIVLRLTREEAGPWLTDVQTLDLPWAKSVTAKLREALYPDPCERCGGSGKEHADHPASPISCRRCGGSGKTTRPLLGDDYPCPRCHGTGKP